jgi:hypothetical protein
LRYALLVLLAAAVVLTKEHSWLGCCTLLQVPVLVLVWAHVGLLVGRPAVTSRHGEAVVHGAAVAAAAAGCVHVAADVAAAQMTLAAAAAAAGSLIEQVASWVCVHCVVAEVA